jgi:hypothetical protein
MQTTNHPAHSLFTTCTRLSRPQIYLISIDHQAPLSSCNCLLLRSRYSPQHSQSLSFHYCEAHTKQLTVQFCVFKSPYIQTANRKPNDLNWMVEAICQIVATPINFPCTHFLFITHKYLDNATFFKDLFALAKWVTYIQETNWNIWTSSHLCTVVSCIKHQHDMGEVFIGNINLLCDSMLDAYLWSHVYCSRCNWNWWATRHNVQFNCFPSNVCSCTLNHVGKTCIKVTTGDSVLDSGE